MKKVILRLSNKNIPIYIGNNILNKSVISSHIKQKDVVIITNTKIAICFILKKWGNQA